jgi:hypothetical protein
VRRALLAPLSALAGGALAVLLSAAGAPLWALALAALAAALGLNLWWPCPHARARCLHGDEAWARGLRPWRPSRGVDRQVCLDCGRTLRRGPVCSRLPGVHEWVGPWPPACAAWDPPAGAGRDTHLCRLGEAHAPPHACRCGWTWPRPAR